MMNTLLIALLSLGSALAADPTAEELLTAMDNNLQSDSQSSTVSMTVDDGRRSRAYQMSVVSRGREQSAIEYQAPDRDKGTRMLKLDDQMWLYLPKAERTQKISGHMMRQGMMGSDMSYEDMMTTDDFDEMYTATLLGSEDLDGRKHWKIEAIARDSAVTYPKRIIWIDDEHRIPTKQELYALSGMLLKTWTMSDVKVIDGRNVPMKMVIQDILKEGSATTIVTEEITFDVPLQDEIFSRRWLERGQ
ncbi:MAG: outer membrane lipoprotein-sorting protein [Myxococcota bacterium]